MDEQPVVKATYKRYGEVTVLQEEGNLTQIDAGDGNIFWVHTAELKSKKAPRATSDVTLIPASGDYADFVVYLQSAGYTLHVRVRDADGRTQAEEEYRAWAGESLPDDCIHLHQNKPVAREWRLRTVLQAGMPCPFPLDPLGTSNGSRSKVERGLLYPEGRIEANYASIAEQLVRVGLRALAPQPGKERKW